ncbi:DNA replication complex GINS protein PSF3 [Adelges cooleyi]|uniref:DNA replication complex GINS protein PSF3 n=1 Tax=Adelges cooleyi TaxID=133065 RepID=UPI002180824D|nr:DNA replication complex GINS protein PSF3 [Adelges cooleyi]
MYKNIRPHYFSIDAIMAAQEKIPCRFTKKIESIGFLDFSLPEKEDEDSDPKVELPLWMVKVFLAEKSIQFDMPKAYNEIYRGVLIADPNVVDLFKLCKHFYLFGKFLSQLEHREAYEVRQVLIRTFVNRFKQTMDWAQNIEDNQPCFNRLDCIERKIFDDARVAQQQLNTYLLEGSGQMEIASMILNYKKRKMHEKRVAD